MEPIYDKSCRQLLATWATRDLISNGGKAECFDRFEMCEDAI